MSFNCHSTLEELQKVLDHLSAQPNSHKYFPITNTIRIELGRGLPIPWKLYSFEKNGTTYWIKHRTWRVVLSHNYLASVGPINKDDLFEALQLFDQELRIFSDGQPHGITGTADIMELAAEFNKLKNPIVDLTLHSCIRYYMTSEQKTLLMSEKLPQLPDGYELGTVRYEESEIIVKNWAHSWGRQLEHTRLDVMYLPNSAIRYKGELVGYYLLGSFGVMQNHFVVAEHRGKNLGTALEMDLSKKLIGKGYDIMKIVELHNEKVIKMTNRSKFWTLEKNREGSPSHAMFTNFKPTKKST